MDITEQRKNYLKKIDQFTSKDTLNPLVNFVKKLSQHPYFCHHTNVIEKFETEEAKRVYIFTELTKERETCDAIAKLIENFGEKALADKLRDFNKSYGPIKILEASKEAIIKVTKSSNPRGAPSASSCFPISKEMRGKCILINNDRNTNKETQRFNHVFSELHFQVEIHSEMSIKLIKKKMLSLSTDKNIEKDEALIVVIMAHGNNEMISGYDDNQSMLITEVIDYFSSTNCPHLLRIPKVFIFDCCRQNVGSSAGSSSNITEEEKEVFCEDANNEDVPNSDKLIFADKFNVMDEKWEKEHRNMFILYSCSEGQLSHWIEPDNTESGTEAFKGLWMSAFAQSFTHAIARYACDENLNEIIKRTNELMAKFEKIKKSSAPQLKEYCAERNLFFNPGYIA